MSTKTHIVGMWCLQELAANLLLGGLKKDFLKLPLPHFAIKNYLESSFMCKLKYGICMHKLNSSCTWQKYIVIQMLLPLFGREAWQLPKLEMCLDICEKRLNNQAIIVNVLLYNRCCIYFFL
jgi:hypothetical protein